MMKDRIEALEKELAELKAELEVSGGDFEEGQWLKSIKFDQVVRYGRPDSLQAFRSTEKYGKEVEGLGHGNWDISLFRPATVDEIEQALVAEAKRRGLVSGATVNCLGGFGEAKIKDRKSPPTYDYWACDDCLWAWSSHSDGSIIIYEKGEWAEIIKDTVTINGVECEVKDNIVKLSCGDEIAGMDVRRVYSLVKKYDLTIMREGDDITPQIKKLGEQL